ncbi:MAG: hypothetical protein HKN13_11735 [Rhodothermales bacterium]|nr:hypothetical protein [Rhodothermales bacterium]
MKPSTWIGVVVALLLLGVGRVYVIDSATVEQAIVVEKYFRDYCLLHDAYPDYETVEVQFPEQYPNQEWYYWPNETFSAATFQYPMTLPIPSAPGRSKFSEFFPVIYSYAVRNPCEGLIPRTSPVE